MTVKIEIEGSKTIEADEGQTLLEILLEAGEEIDNFCNGMGVCGNCKVMVLSGDVTALSCEEKNRLTPEEIEAGVRLSCLTQPKSDLKIRSIHRQD